MTINITRDESDEIEALLKIYEAHLHILKYLLKHGIDKDDEFIQQNFSNAIMYKIELDTAKKLLNQKYCPETEWRKCKVNFFNQTAECE